MLGGVGVPQERDQTVGGAHDRAVDVGCGRAGSVDLRIVRPLHTRVLVDRIIVLARNSTAASRTPA
jgi:hypothetical protein